jgi:hypothetical protein
VSRPNRSHAATRRLRAIRRRRSAARTPGLDGPVSEPHGRDRTPTPLPIPGGRRPVRFPVRRRPARIAGLDRSASTEVGSSRPIRWARQPRVQDPPGGRCRCIRRRPRGPRRVERTNRAVSGLSSAPLRKICFVSAPQIPVTIESQSAQPGAGATGSRTSRRHVGASLASEAVFEDERLHWSLPRRGAEPARSRTVAPSRLGAGRRAPRE